MRTRDRARAMSGKNSFVSYTTTETKGLFAVCLVRENVTCLLSNCLDGNMKNYIDGWVKCFGT